MNAAEIYIHAWKDWAMTIFIWISINMPLKKNRDWIFRAKNSEQQNFEITIKNRSNLQHTSSKECSWSMLFPSMVAYYSHFLPNASIITIHCINYFIKIKFFRSAVWSSLYKIKRRNPYDPNLPVTLATDASPTGIIAMLSNLVDESNIQLNLLPIL